MRKVIIMSGIPGAGKSFEMKKQKDKYYLRDIGVVSADNYFMVDGEYRFDPSKLGNAHGNCLRSFISNILEETREIIIVDNTSSTCEELAPYIAIAMAYGYEVEVMTIMCANEEEVARCHARNTHGVPLRGALAMHQRLLKRVPPLHWSPQFDVSWTQLSPIF